MLLDDSQGLLPLEIHYHKSVPDGKLGSPYWVLQAQVRMDRDVYGFLGDKDGEARSFWARLRLFFVPAFDCDLDRMIDLGLNRLRTPPPLVEGPPVAFAPVTLPQSDVPNLVDFLIVAVEAERRDDIEHIRFTTNLEQPVLWVLPP